MCAIPRAGARRSHLRLRSWFSNVYFRPSNRLYEPTGSISIALKGREQGTLCPPCARSAEYFLRHVTVHSIVPHRRKNSKHTRDTFRGKCPMIVPSLFTATAYRSEAFSGSPFRFRGYSFCATLSTLVNGIPIISTVHSNT